VDIKVLADPQAAARVAAVEIAAAAHEAVRERGRFLLAVSGGRTPWQMLRLLALLKVPWDKVHLLQVDERLAPSGHPDRNLTHIKASLPSLSSRIYPMPVEAEDPDEAAALYARTLQELAGAPPVLDLIHLGLGPDGHTASLVPGDPVLDITHQDVALTEPYQGRRRMTLTYPLLNRARRRLWLVTGSEKADMLVRLRDGDQSIPAGRICRTNALVLADREAASQLA
jgi:6-phosphogluconolactonase